MSLDRVITCIDINKAIARYIYSAGLLNIVSKIELSLALVTIEFNIEYCLVPAL